MTKEDLTFTSRMGRLRLWAAPLIGPAAWLADLQFSYSLNRYSCDAETAMPLHVLSLLCLLIALAGALLNWRDWRQAGREWPGEQVGIMPRTRFLSCVGFFVNLVFVLAIVAQMAPKWMLQPCQ